MKARILTAVADGAALAARIASLTAGFLDDLADRADQAAYELNPLVIDPNGATVHSIHAAEETP